MVMTRRAIFGLAAVPLAGCLSEPERSCRGATVRLSLRPTDGESPLGFDRGALSAEAVAVLETAIDDEHVERCVAWEPSPNETGPSPGLAEIGEAIEAHAGIDLSERAEPVTLDAHFEGTDYRLTLVTDRSR